METPQDQEKYKKLASKWLDKTITEEEIREFNLWYESDPDKVVEIPDSFAQHEEQLETRIFERINTQINTVRIYPLWKRISIAAAVVLLLSVCLYVYNYRGSQHIPIARITPQDSILPGKNGATLTLADGKKINLSDVGAGELAMENGTRISQTEDGQLLYDAGSANPHAAGLNTLTTAKGEMYMMILPDKSRVWLNAASSLTFSPTINMHSSREVTLTGEAYFEVAKDKKRPFIVTTKQQKVTVLGTHFNISSYPDEKEVKTTLIEGSVKVNNLSSKASIILKPDQQSVVDGKSIQVQHADVGEILAWKNGDFVFGGESFEKSMHKIERWYDVEFVYKDPDIKNIPLDGWVSRNSTLSEVLRKIELAGNVKFKRTGRRILIVK
ncbi:FecR family protein [Sphingobacterium spiritivorum]|uniref:FecR family protein n=1 Tax=Sphingobacterium spiritivorum TaxID=258 RepID=UPI003DA2AB53